MTFPYADLLTCPACSGDLSASHSTMTCDVCGQIYRLTTSAQQWDLRLPVPRTHQVHYRLPEPPKDVSNLFERLPLNPDLNVRDLSGMNGPLTYGNRLTPELISYFPIAKTREAWMLDLGCGERNFESICKEQTGFNYVGVDYVGNGPDVLADAHALPFKDQSFDFVLSIAVLEHLAFPDVAMEETFRMLKPGGTFIGTVAFLEPFHMNSYYHMSHLGAARALTHAGFEIVAMAPNSEWSGTRAQAEMTLFPGLPRLVRRSLTSAVTPLSKVLWALRRSIREDNSAANRQRLLETTGGFRFVARRPA